MSFYDDFKSLIKDALRDNGCFADSNGCYYSECYVDYRNEFEDSTIAEILKSSDPMSKLEELLQEAYEQEMWCIENNVLKSIRSNSSIAQFINTFKLDDDSVRDCLRDVWYVNPPYDHYLNQDVCMDIMLDTGDCNYEFTCNNLASTDIERVEDFDNNSSLLWLCEQQGVTRGELLSAFDKGSAHSNEVLELRARKKELIEELKQYGFKTPRFNESVIHTGAYREYTKLVENQLARQGDIARLNSKIEENSVSYEEYLKKHFDRFERLDPMSKEQFAVKKSEILEKLSVRLNEAKNELSKIEEKLSGSVDYANVARLQGEYNDVSRLLSGLAKTDAYKKAEFIDTVHNEILNSYGTSVVTFLVKMTLEEAINLKEVINAEKDVNNSYNYEKRKGLSSFVLDKDVCCGLMDDCSGGGSVFDIKLIKDVEVPVKALYRAVPDRCNGNYGFMEIYGANDEHFSKALKEIHEVQQPKVADLISDAQDRTESAKDSVPGKDSIGLE